MHLPGAASCAAAASARGARAAAAPRVPVENFRRARPRPLSAEERPAQRARVALSSAGGERGRDNKPTRPCTTGTSGRLAADDNGDDDALADDSDGADQQDEEEEETEEELARALRRAVRLVDYRERSTGELMRRLTEDGRYGGSSTRSSSNNGNNSSNDRRRKCSPAAARAAVARLEKAGLVSDARFAELLVRRRWQQRAEAPRAIRRALMAAGVPAEVGEGALAAFFGDEKRIVRPADVDEEEQEQGEEEDTDARMGGKKGVAGVHGGREEQEQEDDNERCDRAEAWRSLVAAAREQARRSEALADPEKRRARLSRWLYARGHSWDTIGLLMKEVGLSDR